MSFECSIPLRHFLGTPFGLNIAKNCGKIRIANVIGACTILTAGLFWGHYYTKTQQEKYELDPTNNQRTVIIPIWICLLPVIYAIWVSYTAIPNAIEFWKTEELKFNSSEMIKKDFLSYTGLDDRQRTSSTVAVLNTILIVSISLFGAFLRGDPR
jgi:hypothetical protein